MSNNFSEDKRRFNIIDALIIILAIACLVTVFLRTQIRTLIGIGENASTCSLRFKVTSISESSLEYFQMYDEFWDKVYLDSPDLELGTIAGTPESKATVIYIEDEKGTVSAVECPPETYVDVIGNITCRGNFKEDGCFYLSGNYAISPGDVLKVHTVGLDFTLTVIDISEISG